MNCSDIDDRLRSHRQEAVFISTKDAPVRYVNLVSSVRVARHCCEANRTAIACPARAADAIISWQEFGCCAGAPNTSRARADAAGARR